MNRLDLLDSTHLVSLIIQTLEVNVSDTTWLALACLVVILGHIIRGSESTSIVMSLTTSMPQCHACDGTPHADTHGCHHQTFNLCKLQEPIAKVEK